MNSKSVLAADDGSSDSLSVAASLPGQVDATPNGAYATLLADYCATGSEESLYRASLLSQEFATAGFGPDEIVSLHTECVQTVVKAYDPRSLVASQQFLLEVMIAFGVRYAEYAEFRLAEARKTVDLEHTRADSATRAEKERLELLGVISHELGQPLTVAKGNVLAIRRFLAENNRLSDDLSSRANDAEMAIERLLTLREELVAASRNEVRELELAPLDVHNAIAMAIRWAEPAAQDRTISLSFPSQAANSRVVADPDALQSILGNLLSNAIRYTPAGGRVTVSTRNDGDYLLVDIADTGIGLSEEAKSRLFERFYRAPEAKQLASWGLGLGLAIASELADALQATISASGEAGEGATFTVRFRCAPQEEE